MRRENLKAETFSIDKSTSFDKKIFIGFVVFLTVLFGGLLIIGRDYLQCQKSGSSDEILHNINYQLTTLSTMIDNGDFVGMYSNQGVTVELLLECKIDILRAIHNQADENGEE